MHNMISLEKIYSFVQQHKMDGEALDLTKPLGSEYCRVCDDVTSQIDEVQGFYIWGCYDTKNYWRSVYLGKAGYVEEKSSLKKRIRGELTDERACFWRAVFTAVQLHEIRERIHRGKYKKEWDRAMWKAGTTHIAWVPTPSITNLDIKHVEADLIEVFEPTVNRQRPTPRKTKVFQQFLKIIEQEGGRFPQGTP
jgi:hypothetical protein